MPTAADLDALDRLIRTHLRAHPDVAHAAAYGSRAQGTADAYSDLEYYAFTRPGTSLDPFAFLQTVTPVALRVVNPFGTPNVITPDLVRLELHVEPDDQLGTVRAWPAGSLIANRALIRDDSGQLRPLLHAVEAATPEAPDLQGIYDELLNWLTFASAVLARGEHLRAHELLTWVHGALLRLARAAADAPQPPAAARFAERDLPPALLARLHATAPGIQHLPAALHAALTFALDLAADLRLQTRATLTQALQERLRGLSSAHHPTRLR